MVTYSTAHSGAHFQSKYSVQKLSKHPARLAGGHSAGPYSCSQPPTQFSGSKPGNWSTGIFLAGILGILGGLIGVGVNGLVHSSPATRQISQDRNTLGHLIYAQQGSKSPVLANQSEEAIRQHFQYFLKSVGEQVAQQKGDTQTVELISGLKLTPEEQQVCNSLLAQLRSQGNVTHSARRYSEGSYNIPNGTETLDKLFTQFADQVLAKHGSAQQVSELKKEAHEYFASQQSYENRSQILTIAMLASFGAALAGGVLMGPYKS